MTRAPRIAIVGGGVGGLAAALALERRGAEIVVCEQSPALNEIGAGLNLSPNALMALRVLGVEDAVIARGSESDFLITAAGRVGGLSRACAEARSASLHEVKKPTESKGAWDYYKLVATIPADQAFQPLSESKCPLVKKAQ